MNHFSEFTSWQKQRFQCSLVMMGFAIGLSCGNSLQADEPLNYNRDIRPILAENCFACHGADSASRKADLRLDVRDEAINFGAIKTGKPDESELIARIYSDDADLVMPPPKTRKTLTKAQKEKLKKWIASGAEYQAHWSLIAPKKPELPEVTRKSWVKNSIDQFILAALTAKGLSPAVEAQPHVIFRRLHFDITGLPPTPEDSAAFVLDYQKRKDAALSEWIDQLMKSTSWGEHRARYWLDAARYGDTHGLHFDNYREMWPYRDWVIRSFNANQPFNQFTVEQFAGDLLPNPTDDQLIATGFQRCNITTNEGGTIDEENLANYAADRVQTFGWVYLGMTTNCAQCHDHKFDSFTMKDYYSLAAFFRNTTQGPKDGNVKDGRGPILVVPIEKDQPRWKALPDEITEAHAKRNQHKIDVRPKFEEWLADATVDSIQNTISDDSLLIHVPLNEGTGNEVKSIAEFPMNYKASGDLAWVSGGKLGPAPIMKSGSTISLGAIGDFEKNQEFSYGAWVKAQDNRSTGSIIARIDEKNQHRGWDLWQNGRSYAVHLVDSWPKNSIKVLTAAPVVKAGQWQHVFVTYEGSGVPNGIKIYIDGKLQKHKVEKNTLTPDASIRTETPLQVGQRSETGVFEGGAVQDVRVYSRVLSDKEVQQVIDVSQLQVIMTTETEKRTPQQKDTLFEYYLSTLDPDFPELNQSITKLEAERDAIKARSPVTHIQVERKDSPAMAKILMRGAYDKPGDEVVATTPGALHPMPPDAPKNRLGLANWLVDPANPLTARVTVNRFWQEIFGQGIVVTAEDFGVMGALPTHPDLLDWMAVEFRENQWDVKKFFKTILMSATYRQSAAVTPEKLEKDRDNSLLSRGPRFRMDAEMVRDNALAVSGLLSTKMYGPGTRPYQPEGIWDIVGLPSGNTRNYVQDNGENLYRRTLYNFWKRMAPPPNLEAFNATSREVCTVRRERTNTPLQALVTLNDPQFVEAARHLAQQAITVPGNDESQTLNFITQRVLCRTLSAKEQAVILSVKKEYLDYYQAKTDDAKALIAVGDSKADEKLDAAQLATWTMICNQIMNLDEVLNK